MDMDREDAKASPELLKRSAECFDAALRSSTAGGLQYLKNKISQAIRLYLSSVIINHLATVRSHRKGFLPKLFEQCLV